MCSLLLDTLAYCVLPQGSVVVGRNFSRFAAGILNNVGEMRLPWNGAGKLICLPAVLQLGAVTAVKSPASICGVGMKAMVVAGADRLVVVCSPAKKKSLFF